MTRQALERAKIIEAEITRVKEQLEDITKAQMVAIGKTSSFYSLDIPPGDLIKRDLNPKQPTQSIQAEMYTSNAQKLAIQFRDGLKALLQAYVKSLEEELDDL